MLYLKIYQNLAAVMIKMLKIKQQIESGGIILPCWAYTVESLCAYVIRVEAGRAARAGAVALTSCV